MKKCVARYKNFALINPKVKIKFLAVLLCISAMLSSLPASALDISGIDSLGAEVEARKQNVFNEQIAIMEANHQQLHEEEGPITLSISEIKDVYDFAGNTYTLVELEPTGYMLFHDESGIFVEYSSRSSSPYLGIYDELYYAGIKEYYSKEVSNNRLLSSDTVYRHTITDEMISETALSEYERFSNDMNTALLAEKNENIVNYIQKNTPLQLETDTASQRTTTYNGMTVVKDYTFFTRLDDCGYFDVNGDGVCGYIAAGMLLAYRQYAFGETCVAPSYIADCEEVRLNIQVTPNNAGPKVAVSTNASKIYYTLRNYSSNAVVSQGSVNSSSNDWDFSLWSLAAGQYKFQAQATGGNCETITFTKGTTGVITNMRVTPDDAGPRVTVSTNGNKIYYTLRDSSDAIKGQGSVNSNSNNWNFASWNLAAGEYEFQAQSTSGKCETFTFTVNKPRILQTLPTILYNTGRGLGYGTSTTSRSIRFTVNQYLSERGFSPVNYIDEWAPIADNIYVANCIDGNKPVIWFGGVIENTADDQTWMAHAVVVYGYSCSWGLYSFVAHFGWENGDNPTEVYFTGAIGSMYTCWR